MTNRRFVEFWAYLAKCQVALVQGVTIYGPQVAVLVEFVAPAGYQPLVRAS